MLQTTIAGVCPSRPGWPGPSASGRPGCCRRDARRGPARRGAGRRSRSRRRPASTSSPTASSRGSTSSTAFSSRSRASTSAGASPIGIRANRYKAEVPTVIGPLAPAAADPPRRGALGARPHRPPAQVHDSRADDDRRHARRRALPRPPRLALEFARIINEEARELVAAGLDVLQLDEPAFNVYMDDVADVGYRRAAPGDRRARPARPPCTSVTATASRPTSTGRQTLGQRVAPVRADVPAAGGEPHRPGSLECANSRVPISLLGLLAGKDVLVGCIDVATNTVETPEEVAATIRRALQYVPAERLYPCTNCGMVPLPREVARAKLHALGAGAKIVRRELGG